MIDNYQLPAGLAELKMRFERMVGFNTTYVPDPRDPEKRGKLDVQAPFGQRLGYIDVGLYDGEWKFGGTSSFMPDSWNALCDLKVKVQ